MWPNPNGPLSKLRLFAISDRWWLERRESERRWSWSGMNLCASGWNGQRQWAYKLTSRRSFSLLKTSSYCCMTKFGKCRRLRQLCWLHKNRYQEWSLKAAMDTLNMGILWLAVIFCCYHDQWMRLLHWWFTLPISFTNTLGSKFFRHIWRQRVRCWWLGGHVELFQLSVVAPCCRGLPCHQKIFVGSCRSWWMA